MTPVQSLKRKHLLVRQMLANTTEWNMRCAGPEKEDGREKQIDVLNAKPPRHYHGWNR